MIKVYFTKHGNAGRPDADVLTLPACSEDITAFLARADADDISYKSLIPGLCECFGKHENIGELNYLSALLKDVPNWLDETLSAAIQFGVHTGSIKDLINLVQNLDYYYLYDDATSEEELGYFHGIELGWLDIDEEDIPDFDFEEYGQDLHEEMCGEFVDGGYIVCGEFVDGGYIVSDDNFIEHYSGPDDLPDKYKSSAFSGKRRDACLTA